MVVAVSSWSPVRVRLRALTAGQQQLSTGAGGLPVVSYLAISQCKADALQPPSLKAICPCAGRAASAGTQGRGEPRIPRRGRVRQRSSGTREVFEGTPSYYRSFSISSPGHSPSPLSSHTVSVHTGGSVVVDLETAVPPGATRLIASRPVHSGRRERQNASLVAPNRQDHQLIQWPHTTVTS